MDEICSATADPHYIESAGLFGVDDVVYPTVNGIGIIVVTDAGARILSAHSDVAVPLRVTGCVKA